MLAGKIVVVPYDPTWPVQFEHERARLKDLPFLAIEHFGSTAIPGLQAKPIIDILAKVAALPMAKEKLRLLADLGYAIGESGMRNRLYLRKELAADQPALHLHILAESDWDLAHERLMRDHLLARPDQARAYGALKDRLAIEFRDDREAYTRAKTEFIQKIVDAARDARGLPRVNVWID